jgi:hypothetical protein
MEETHAGRQPQFDALSWCKAAVNHNVWPACSQVLLCHSAGCSWNALQLFMVHTAAQLHSNAATQKLVDIKLKLYHIC